MPKQPCQLKQLYFKIDKGKIGFLKFLLEGYDGLCVLTTVASKEGRIKLIVPESRYDELDLVIKSVAEQLHITSDEAIS